MVKQRKRTPIESLPEPHKTVASIIRTGRQNATQMSDIISITGIKEKRIAYKVIETLIKKHGFVIVASRKGKAGYFYPANESEFKQAIKTFKTEYKSMEKRYEALLDNFYKV